MKADRVVRGGKVAVLYSPGYGAGWSTWNSSDGEGNDGLENFLLYDPTLVSMVEDDRRDSIPKYVESVYPESYFYGGGASKLSIYWVPEGVMFRVTEYDGSESIEFRDAEDWKIA
jgi:hypothetical protein